ncbi:hypothetical protein JJB11_10820 [Ramlibacter ginsenosidimutans]|uniref:Uncharacterized protein n=1 Tax=Ramlibacter ginsenosidimutans TaxID=502333 RepID=A0A934TSN9_9BURK|nr:hypothetical protein [Ramlibacter ginsenosidimutans]MBK6006585.1 hypothetical protein [Ramlibacter ginsenosidimutans]
MNYQRLLSMHHHAARFASASLIAAAAALSCAHAAPAMPTPGAGTWTPTWIAAPEPTWGPDFALPVGMPLQLENVTLRQNLRVSLGGDQIRLVISNAYSDRPLKIGRAHVGVQGGKAGFATFQGASKITVAAGGKAVSDPIALPRRARLPPFTPPGAPAGAAIRSCSKPG